MIPSFYHRIVISILKCTFLPILNKIYGSGIKGTLNFWKWMDKQLLVVSTAQSNALFKTLKQPREMGGGGLPPPSFYARGLTVHDQIIWYNFFVSSCKKTKHQLVKRILFQHRPQTLVLQRCGYFWSLPNGCYSNDGPP